jgi:hypothetical protein
MDKTEDKAMMIDRYKYELKRLGEAVEGEGAAIADTREESEYILARAEKSIGTLKEFQVRSRGPGA